MSEINLLESTTFTKRITCQLPGQGVDTLRDFTFTATFCALPQDEWEDLISDSPKSVAVAAVLEAVDGIPGASVDGKELSGVEVAIRNPFTCDALFAEYALFVSRNGRNAAMTAAEEKNSRRSRRR